MEDITTTYDYTPTTRNTIDRYHKIYSLYCKGWTSYQLKDKFKCSYLSIRRAIRFCRKSFAFTKPEEIDDAIRIKEQMKREAYERLEELRAGWTEQRVKETEMVVKGKDGETRLPGKKTEKSVAKKFSPSDETKLLALIRDLDNDIIDLKGLRNLKLRGRYDPTTGEFEAEATKGTFLDCWRFYNPEKESN